MRGRIQWFDASSGEGMVESEDGMAYYLNFTCIDGIDRNNWAYPTAADQARLKGIHGRPVEFTLYTNLYSSRVDRLKFVD
jgi:hypothetical protein